jgi:[protein-PII] uridylyltransferase
MAANRLQIQSAQIFSIDLRGAAPGARTAALDILSVRDADGGICEDPERWARVREDLQRVVVGGEDVGRLIAQRLGGSRLPRRPKPHVETKVVVARGASERETVIDVFCQDHLGALHRIAQAFADQGMSIRLAKVSTQGDRVADGFYVTDAVTKERIQDEARLGAAVAAIKAAIEEGIARS